ncbi:MAG: trypsin-like peptidase domain-containing protein [Candidatus Gracilibacteria bacterium]|jgi:serine protease Do
MDKKQLSKNILTSSISGGVAALIVSLLVVNLMDPNGFTGSGSSNSENGDTTNLSDEKDFISEEDLIINAVEKASPAVVSIIITKDVPVLEQYYEDYGSPFSDFFGDPSMNFQIPQYRDSGETEKQEIGGGSGFIVSSDGYVITNKHVVDDEEADYTVFTTDGKEYIAKVIDKDALNDIAVLKIEGENFPYLEFGDSEGLKAGQTVIAIGNPLLEFNNSVSVGVISGLLRSITAGTTVYGETEYLEGIIQTDAAINPGNSGGPLLDINGKVIGVNVAVADGENIGFSIPANLVKDIVDSVKEHGKIIRPFLGIRYVQITESFKEKNSLEFDYGVLVLRGETAEDLAVIPGSPADKAGLVENDIILEVDGKKLDGSTSLAKMISTKKVGDELKLKILHKGEEKEVTVKLEESELQE